MIILGSLATWYFWAWYAAGLAVMTITLAIHLRTSHMRGRGPWLLVIGGGLGALGAIIGGMQAGPFPPLYPAMGVAVIRLCLVMGVTLGVVAAGMYLWWLKERK
jgi:hypothetical protein